MKFHYSWKLRKNYFGYHLNNPLLAPPWKISFRISCTRVVPDGDARGTKVP